MARAWKKGARVPPFCEHVERGRYEGGAGRVSGAIPWGGCVAMRGWRLRIPVRMPHLHAKGGADGACGNEGRRLGGEGARHGKRGVVYALFLFICIVNKRYERQKKADFEFEYRRNGENGPDRGKCAESQDFALRGV